MSYGTYNFEILPLEAQGCRVRDINVEFLQEYVEKQGVLITKSAWVVDHGTEDGVRTKEREIAKPLPPGDLVKGYRMSAVYHGQVLELTLDQAIPARDGLESIAGKLTFEASAAHEEGYDLLRNAIKGQIPLMGYKVE